MLKYRVPAVDLTPEELKRELIEDAVRHYLEAVAITELAPNQVAKTQAKLLTELPPIPTWEVDDA